MAELVFDGLDDVVAKSPVANGEASTVPLVNGSGDGFEQGGRNANSEAWVTFTHLIDSKGLGVRHPQSTIG